MATEVSEEVIIPAGSLSTMSVNGYEDFCSITKLVGTSSNVVVTDTENNELAMIPNHQYDARNTIIQIQDKCYNYLGCCMLQCRCLDVLYKPRFTGWTTFSSPVESAMSLALLNKALEIAKMRASDDPSIFADKATAIYVGADNNYSAGKSLRLQYRRGPFTSHYGGYL